MTTVATPPASHRRSHRVGVLLATLLLGPMALGAAAPGDGSPDEQGYWWRSPVLAADQTVPDGGLVVAGQPEGPLAVSALRFTLDDPDEMAASIHLTVDSDSREAFIEEPLLYACPAEEDWESTEDGDWDDVPGEHCSPGSAAEGEIGEDGEYVFVVSNFIVNGEIDVIITPGMRGAVPSPLLLQLLNDELVDQIGTGAPWPGPPTVDGLDGSNVRVTFDAPNGDTLRTGEDSADEAVTSLTFDGDNEFDGDFGDPGDGDLDDSDVDEGGFDEGDADGAGQPGAVADPPDTSGPTGSADMGPDSAADTGADTDGAPQPQTADPPEAADDGGRAVQDTPPGAAEESAPPVALEEDPQAGGMGDAEPAGSLGTDPRMLGALVLALGALGAGVLAMGPQGLGIGAAVGGSRSSGIGGLAQFARPRQGPPPSL